MREPPRRLSYLRLAAAAACAGLMAAGCRPGAAETRAPAGVAPPPAGRPAQPAVGQGSPASLAVEVASPAEEALRERIAEASVGALRSLAASDVVLRSVSAANTANRETMAEILERDRRWRATAGGEDPLLTPYLKNDCADLLRSARLEHKRFLELFVADARGCIVAASNRTSDYWQGDEDKWTRCFRGGDGRLFVDEINYDDSTQSYVVQVSVPVQGKDGATIGVLTSSVQAHAGR